MNDLLINSRDCFQFLSPAECENSNRIYGHRGYIFVIIIIFLIFLFKTHFFNIFNLFQIKGAFAGLESLILSFLSSSFSLANSSSGISLDNSNFQFILSSLEYDLSGGS
jgi:hypothetical protein